MDEFGSFGERKDEEEYDIPREEWDDVAPMAREGDPFRFRPGTIPIDLRDVEYAK